MRCSDIAEKLVRKPFHISRSKVLNLCKWLARSCRNLNQRRIQQLRPSPLIQHISLSPAFYFSLTDVAGRHCDSAAVEVALRLHGAPDIHDAAEARDIGNRGDDKVVLEVRVCYECQVQASAEDCQERQIVRLPGGVRCRRCDDGEDVAQRRTRVDDLQVVGPSPEAYSERDRASLPALWGILNSTDTDS